MTLLRTQFPRDSSGPKRKTPVGLFEQLVRAAMLDGLTRAEAVARVRTLFPFLKEATMTNCIVLDDGTMIEAPLTFRQAGDEVDEVSGSAKTLVEKVRIARELRPEAARVYEGVGGPVVGPGFVRPLDPLARPPDVEGPRHQPVPVPDALLMKKIEDYRDRYPEVAEATTPGEFFKLFYAGLTREDPVNAYANYKRALVVDQELYTLYNRATDRGRA